MNFSRGHKSDTGFYIIHCIGPINAKYSVEDKSVTPLQRQIQDKLPLLSVLHRL